MQELRYNLQLFAKEGAGGEKTEPATAKKLSDARKDGQVAKSKEIVNAVYLLVIFYILKFTLGIIGENIIENFHSVYSAISVYATGVDDITNIGIASALFKEALFDIIIIITINNVLFIKLYFENQYTKN